MRVCVHVFLFVTRADGVMRTMNTEKLIKTLPTIQNQLDALLDFQVNISLNDTQKKALQSVQYLDPISLFFFCFRSVFLFFSQTPTSWPMEWSTQPSCCCLKTPYGCLLLTTKGSSTCWVSHTCNSADPELMSIESILYLCTNLPLMSRSQDCDSAQSVFTGESIFPATVSQSPIKDYKDHLLFFH